MVLDRPYMTKKDRRRVAIGLSLTVIGGLLFFNFQSILNNALKSQLQVKEGNDFTSAWNKNPFPISLDMYIFNIENPEEFASGAKAKLAEKGPYSYNMWLYKEIISFNEDQTKVRFWESQSFEFRDDSLNKLSDKVTVLNFPVYALANMVRSLINDLPLSFAIEPVAIGFVNILLMSHGESLIKELTVGELLNGYPFSILNTIDTVTRPLVWLGVRLPDSGMPDNKFGLLWTKNYTKGGPFEAYSGQKGTQLLKLLSFKDQSSLNFYNEPRCNQINGTEGSTLEVDVNKEKTYYVFTTDTCRTFDLVYEKDTWVNGIPTYRFIPNPKLFAAPSKNPENRCYCRTPENEEWCDGIFDLGPCLKGAPAAYSFPHFYGASNTLKNNVENMRPDPEQHQAFIDVEPFMGAPIRGAEKLQMNAIIKPIDYLAGFRNFPESVLPLMWMKKGAVINDEFTLKMRLAIWPLYFILMLIYGLFFGGMAMLGFVGFRIYRKRGQTLEMKNVGNFDAKRSESQEPLQLDFNKSSSDQATLEDQQTPAAAVSVVQLSRAAVQHQSPAWHTASYSAVSHQTGPPRIYFQSIGSSDDSRLSNDALSHTAQYQNETLQKSEDRSSLKQGFSQRPTAPVEPVSYPRLTYSSTTFQRPRVGPMSGVSTRYIQSVETPRNAVLENQSSPKRSEGAKQMKPYPRLTYSNTTYQSPRVGPLSALSTRYGHAPILSTLEKVDEVPALTDASSSVNSEPYPRLTYSNTTYRSPRVGPMSGVSLRYNQSPAADNKIENVPIQSGDSQSRESYPQTTYSNTTYQDPRSGPMFGVSLRHKSQLVATTDNYDENVSILSESSAVPPESYAHLTYSNTTFRGPQSGNVSAAQTRYDASAVASSNAENFVPNATEIYPRMTYSSTTYQNPRTGPISAASTHYARQIGDAGQIETVKDVQKTTKEQPSDEGEMLDSQHSILDDFYNDEVDLDAQTFGMTPSAGYDYDNMESTWTSVNEIIGVKEYDNEMEKKDETVTKDVENSKNSKETAKKANENKDRITWSPPGSID